MLSSVKKNMKLIPLVNSPNVVPNELASFVYTGIICQSSFTYKSIYFGLHLCEFLTRTCIFFITKDKSYSYNFRTHLRSKIFLFRGRSSNYHAREYTSSIPVSKSSRIHDETSIYIFEEMLKIAW